MYKVLYAESANELEAKINYQAEDGWSVESVGMAQGSRGMCALAVMSRGQRVSEPEPMRYKDVPAPTSA